MNDGVSFFIFMCSISFLCFLNDSLFGNIKIDGSNSFPHYFFENWNVGNAYSQSNTILNDIFKGYGYSDIYTVFGAELTALDNEYMQLSKYGTLYQIAVPRNDVDKTVAVAESGGYHRQLTINGEKTRDMHKIVDAINDFDNYPEE